ncbi:MAG: AMP-binding protein [Fulvivirga sp.]
MESFKQVLSAISDKKLLKRPFYVTEANQYNYGDFIKRVNKIRTLLQSKNVKQGDRIVVSILEGYDMFCVTLALMIEGVSAVLIEPDAKRRRAGIICSSAKIDGWIVDKPRLSDWELPDVKFQLALETSKAKKGALLKKLLVKKEETEQKTLDTIIEPYEPLEKMSSIPKEEGALIIYTSGTTSDPKGVILTHGNILAHLASLSSQYDLTKSSVILNILPLYHVDGIIQGPLLTLFNAITLSRPFDFQVQKIEDLLHSIYKYKISHFFTVPTMMSLIDQFGDGLEDSFDTPEFKHVISVAGYLEENLWSKFMERFNVKVSNVYGLTETVTGGFFCGPKESSWKLGSIGKPVDSEVKILNDNGEEVDVNELGELVIRGNHVMKSYVVPTDNPDTQGWFYTGDLATKDEDGFYFIKGRIKNVIIKGGINIYPEEIIEVLNLNTNVVESFVYGEKDPTWGEKVIAVVKMEQSAVADLNDLQTFCAKNLEGDKIPDEIYFLDEFPKGISGKIIGAQVKVKVENNIKAIKSAPQSDDSLQERLLSIASKCFNFRVTSEDLNLPTQQVQGWNSLEHLHLATMIEETFNIKLSTKDIMNISSLSKAEKIIQEKLTVTK